MIKAMRSGCSAPAQETKGAAEWMKLHRPETRILGIVGGLGPETGCIFCLNINIKFKAKTGSQPHLILDNLPITGESEGRLIRGGASGEHFRLLEESIALFNKVEVDLIAIPCNTVHVFLPELRHISAVPILSILEETAKECKKLGLKKVGLLASTKTVREKLHENELGKTGIEVILPDGEEQEFVSGCIVRIINRETKKDDGQMMLGIIKNLEKKGAEGIVLGCTDLPLLVSKLDMGLPVVNTTAVLEDAAVGFLLGQGRDGWPRLGRQDAERTAEARKTKPEVGKWGMI